MDYNHVAFPSLGPAIRDEKKEDTTLGSEHPGIDKPAKHQGPAAESIAVADEFFGGEPNQRIGTFDLQQRLDELLHEQAFLAAGDKMENHFGVGGRLADGTLGDQPVAKRERVGEIAVVGKRKAA